MMDKVLARRCTPGEGSAEHGLCGSLKVLRVQSRVQCWHAFRHLLTLAVAHQHMKILSFVHTFVFSALLVASFRASDHQPCQFIVPSTQLWHQDLSSKWTTSTASSSSSKVCQEQTTTRYDSLTETTITQHMAMMPASSHKTNTRQPR